MDPAAQRPVPTDPPANGDAPEDPLARWLAERGLAALAQALRGQGLTRELLAAIGPEAWPAELGIADLDLRARLWAALAGARGPQAPGSVDRRLPSVDGWLPSVDGWLEGLGLGHHAAAFRERGVRPEHLPVLASEDLRGALGVVSYAERRALRRAAAALRGEELDLGVLLTLELERLPFPVAHPLSFVDASGLGFDRRLDNLIFAGYQTLRVVALLLLADYLDAPVRPSPRVDQAARLALRRPHWSEWTTLTQHLVRLWTRRPEGQASRFPALVAGWTDYGRPSGAPPLAVAPLLEGLPGVNQAQAASVNDALWRARNDLAHRRSTRTGDGRRDRELLRRLAPALERGLAALFPAGAFELLRRAPDGPDGPRAWSFHGPHPDLAFEAVALAPDVAARLPAGGIGVRVGDPAVVLEVHPLIALVEAHDDLDAPPEPGGGRTRADLGLVDGSSVRGVELLGVRWECVAPEHLDALTRALERKRIDLGAPLSRATLWDQAEAAQASARERLERLRARGWLRETYVARPDLDDRVRACLEAPGRALLLLGEPGSGKSALLARLVDELTDDEDGSDERPALPRAAGPARPASVVAYLQGRADLAADEAHGAARRLADAAARALGILPGDAPDLATLCRRLEATRGHDLAGPRRLVLVLDAPDEAPDADALFDALDELLPALGACEGTRLVLALRTSSYRALAARRHARGAPAGAGPFRHADRLHLFADPRGDEAVPYLDVRPFEDDEAARAYAAWQALGPERASTLPFERLPASGRALLRSPLLLHLFHATYPGAAAVPSDLDEARLFSDHLDRVCAELPGLAQALLRVGEALLAGRRSGLTAEDADALDAWSRAGAEAWSRDGADSAASEPPGPDAPETPLARAVRRSPLEALLGAGVLVPAGGAALGADRHEVAFVFGHARLAEQVLLRALRARLAPDTRLEPTTLLGWAREAAGDDATPPVGAALAALERLVAELARAGDGAPLAALLALERPGPLTQLLGGALEALARAWGPTPDGAAGPRAVLDALVTAARAGALAAGRFLAATDGLPKRMQQEGASPFAWALAEARRELLEAALAADPADLRARLDLAGTLVTCADLGRKLDRARDPIPGLEAARAHLAAAPPPADPELARALEEQLAFATSQLAFRLRRARRDDVAWARADEAVALRRRLLAGAPDDDAARRNLAFGLNEAAFQLARRDPTRSVALYEEALRLTEPILAADPRRADVARVVAFAHSHLPDACVAAGDLPAAERHARASLAAALEALAAQPQRVDLYRTAAYAQRACAKVADARGDGPAALAADRELVRLRREVVARDPGRDDYRDELADALREATARAARFDPAQAEAWRAELGTSEPT